MSVPELAGKGCRLAVGIVGPTGSGKSALSVALAKACEGEVISCDALQVYRRLDEGGSGKLKGDVIGLASEPAQEGIPLLEQVMAGGKRTRTARRLEEVRAYCLDQLRHLPPELLALEEPAPYPVERSERLVSLAEKEYAEAEARLEQAK